VTVTYVYENEKFALEIFELLKKIHNKSLKAVWWHPLEKRIDTTDISYRFVYYKQLNDGYRGYKCNQIYFEPTLLNVMTQDQLRFARFSVIEHEMAYKCLTLDETLDYYRKRDKK